MSLPMPVEAPTDTTPASHSEAAPAAMEVESPPAAETLQLASGDVLAPSPDAHAALPVDAAVPAGESPAAGGMTQSPEASPTTGSPTLAPTLLSSSPPPQGATIALSSPTPGSPGAMGPTQIRVTSVPVPEQGPYRQLKVEDALAYLDKVRWSQGERGCGLILEMVFLVDDAASDSRAP